LRKLLYDSLVPIIAERSDPLVGAFGKLRVVFFLPDSLPAAEIREEFAPVQLGLGDLGQVGAAAARATSESISAISSAGKTTCGCVWVGDGAGFLPGLANGDAASGTMLALVEGAILGFLDRLISRPRCGWDFDLLRRVMCG
jgi:hypothetical protein